MALFDDIFPSERNERLVQTEWADSWFLGAIGFARAAEYLTEHRQAFGATIDQVGLAIFFLQRHRAEMVLKALLDAVRVEVPGTHVLGDLWKDCERALTPKDEAAWRQFAGDHYELVEVLGRVDERSYTFRYPVDRKGRKVKRPEFIDLEVLNRQVERLDFGVSGYIDFLDDRGLL